MITMFRQASRQALLTFVGMALIKIASGIIGIWGTVNIYFFSYIHNQGHKLSPATNSIILLCVVVPAALAMMASTALCKRFGYKTVVKVCGLVFAITPFLINIKLTTVTLAIFYMAIPVSCMSIASVPVLNCLWSQYPNHLNKVSGAAVLFFALGTIIFNLIFTFIVNPHNSSAQTQPDKQVFFPTSVTDKIFVATNTVLVISGLSYIAGSFMIQKNQEGRRNQNVHQLAEESPPEAKDQVFKTTDKLSSESDAGIQEPRLTRALKDKKFIILFTISYFIPTYLIYLTLYMKLIFMAIIQDDHYLATCAISVTVSALLGAPFQGYVGDRVGFKKTLLVIIVIDCGFKVIELFCQQKWNIIIMYFLLGFQDKGIITIIGPGLIEIFGLEIATELIPYKALSLFLAFLTVPILQIAFQNVLLYQQLLALFLLFTMVALAFAYYFSSRIHYTKHSDPERGRLKQAYEQKNIDNFIP